MPGAVDRFRSLRTRGLMSAEAGDAAHARGGTAAPDHGVSVRRDGWAKVS